MSENEVFVTYSWDSKEHNEQVISFVNFLRQNGFHAEMDRSVSQNHSATDFRKMMHRAMTDYKKVIVVLSRGYKVKAHEFKGGVGTEYALIIKDIEYSVNKYILVSFEDISHEIIPLEFREREIVYLGNDENYNTLYAKLQDENLIEFSEVSKSKPTVIKQEIKEFQHQKQKKASLLLLMQEALNAKLPDSYPNEGELGVTVILNSETISEFKEYEKIGWINLKSNGNTMSMGNGNQIGNSIEDKKRPWGMGSGFILIINKSFYE